MDADTRTPKVVFTTEARADSSRTTSVYPDELWSSKALNLLWLPRADNWHSPCLLNVSSPEAGMLDDRDRRTTNAAQWFWKVDLQFGAWVCRTIKRAKQAKRDINADLPGVSIAFAIIREYLESTFPHCCEGIELLSEKPVRLDETILIDAIEFTRFNPMNWTATTAEGMPCVPKWEGWDKAQSRRDTLAKGPGPGEAKPNNPTTSKQDAGRKLF